MANVMDYISADVMHKRLLPKVNSFVYSVFYLGFPMDNLNDIPSNFIFGINKPALFSFYNKDHGYRDNRDPNEWACQILEDYQLKNDIKRLYLITMPRILGYVFNPVSFWVCYNQEDQIIAVLYEVNNTFNETHTYICFHQDKRSIQNDDILIAQKCFHVSPFMNREGEYQFRFYLNNKKLGIWIDYYNEHNQKKLLTSVIGQVSPVSKKKLLLKLACSPFIVFKVIFLIHYQAVKLFLLGIKYVPKPVQEAIQTSKNIT